MREAVVSLSRQFEISRRQAYRYLREAEMIGHPVPVVAPSVPITLKIPANIVGEVRAYSVISGLALSEIVRAGDHGFPDRPDAGMADRRSRRVRYKVHLDYAFDRLHASKLQQVYERLVPDQARIAGEGSKMMESDNADSGNLCAGVVGQQPTGCGFLRRSEAPETRRNGRLFRDHKNRLRIHSHCGSDRRKASFRHTY